MSISGTVKAGAPKLKRQLSINRREEELDKAKYLGSA
jgi:hypothetical protein